MTLRIIAGYVDGPGGRDALALAEALAGLDPASELVVTTVYGYNPPQEPARPEGWRKVLRDRADAELDGARRLARGRERTTFRPACGISPADGLHRLAEDLDATLLVVGVSRAHGLGRIVAGSATEQTLHGAPCAVAVAPSGYAERPAHAPAAVLAAYNGSPEASRALELAADVARRAGARLRIAGVAEQAALWYGDYMGTGMADDLREYLGHRLEDAARRTTGVDDVATELLEGDPAEALAAAAASADLLVLGSRDHGPFWRVMLGSVSSRLVAKPPCPVLVLPRTAGASGPPQRPPEERAPGRDAVGTTA